LPTRTEPHRGPGFSTPDLISWLHDAANLIRNIDICTHLLASPDLDTHTRRGVHESAARSIALLKDMFPTLRRPPRRGQGRAVCELNEAVQASADLMRQQARIAKVTIEVVPTSELLFVKGDRGTYQRLLSNLVLNAIEACGPGGRVLMRLGRASDTIVLVIADNGSGMSQSVRRRLFKEPVTTKRKGSGRGLLHGAATVAALGGAIAVESRLGKGTSVVLRFPAGPVPKGLKRARERRH
jgi:signal transduction histidine kinase